MLTEIQISNFAIIENQSITFSEGLNVLTGETGSGKSIILDALGLILGERASMSSIRSGADTLEVHAHFDLSNIDDEVRKTLPDVAKNSELAITRSISSSGRGKVYINGNLNTVSVLNEIGSRLISICSQSQQVSLLNPGCHLSMLDGFCNNQALLMEFQKSFLHWKEKKEHYEKFELLEKEKATKLIWLEETINELELLNPQQGLREKLEANIRQQSNHQKIQEKFSFLEEALSSPDGLLALTTKISGLVSDLAKLNPSAAALQQKIIEIKELAFDFDRQSKLSESEFANNQQNEDEESMADRMTRLARLERKHNTDDKGLYDLLEESRSTFAKLSAPAQSNLQLKEELNHAKQMMDELADKLSQARKLSAKSLAKMVAKELAELNMSGAKLSIEFKDVAINAQGKDSVEFFLQPNVGESAKPLRQIASGGELSRILLVLKKILRDKSGVNVLVFDEVDTGISGSIATAVGQKLKALSNQSQVICITHLPQVASFADHHLLVEKSTNANSKRTVTLVKQLSQKERIDEIARMLSGFTVTQASRRSAEELLKLAV